jgi:hypothetical protein
MKSQTAKLKARRSEAATEGVLTADFADNADFAEG